MPKVSHLYLDFSGTVGISDGHDMDIFANSLWKKFNSPIIRVNGVNCEEDVKKLGMTVGEFAKILRRDCGRSAEETFAIEGSVYSLFNWKRWEKSRASIKVNESDVDTYFEQYRSVEPMLDEIDLPYSDLVITVDLNKTSNDDRFIIYQLSKREGKYDVVIISWWDDNFRARYFPADLGYLKYLCAGEKKFNEYAIDDLTRKYIDLFWRAFLFLAVYNHEYNVISVRRVRIGKQGGKREPVSGIPNNVIVITSREKDKISAPGSALSVDGLIPPDERKIEYVMRKGHRKTPERHLVAGHYRTYWTGKGRKIPIRRFIRSYECGGTPGDKITSKAKIYK